MHHAVRRRRPPPRNFFPRNLARRRRHSAAAAAAAATPLQFQPIQPTAAATLQPAHRSRPPLRARSFDKQAKMKKNTCGKTSFDSFDGMTCVEEPASGKWVCQ